MANVNKRYTSKEKMTTAAFRDGGYGWVIVAAFFLVEVIADGVRLSWGLFYIEFLSAFNTSKTETSLVGAVMQASLNMGGPIFAVIVKTFGYRKSSTIGSLIMTLGFITSFYSTNIYHLYFTFGFLQGIGCGLLFLSGTVAVGQYFQKKRALAIGIAFCGSGVGTFIFPPLTRVLLETYAWRGCLLLYAGLTLQICVFCALLRPFHSFQSQLKETEHKNEQECYIGVLNDNSNAHLLNELQRKPLQNNNFIQEIEVGKTVTDPSIPNIFDHIMSSKGEHEFGSHQSLNVSVLALSIMGSNASFDHVFEKINDNYKTYNLRTNEDGSQLSVEETCNIKFKNSFIENVFPKALVTNVNFVILMISTLFIGIPFFVPMSMLPDYAISIGSSESAAAWLLSAIGISGTFTRLVSGWVSDIPCVDRLTLNGACLLIIGIITTVAAIVPTYEILITYSSFFGLCYGALYVVQPIVLLEYVGEQYIGEIMGMLMCVYGVSGLIGTPLAGFIFDLTGSYKTSFLFAGISFFVSGIINFFVLCPKTGRNVKQRRFELEIEAMEDDVK